MKRNKNLIVEKREYVFLKRILNINGFAGEISVKNSLHKLISELQSAQILDEDDMPFDTVRFNSRVTITSSNNWERTLQLVLPSERNFEQGKISVLTPMGSALFGYSKGDTIEWDFPGGTKKIFIKNVEQQPHLKEFDVPI